MKLIFLFALAVLPGAAQFRSVSVWFSGTGCASCTESLPARIHRLRGVESAAVNAEKGILEVRLAERNRVRLEQIRDFIEQDGTKTTRSVVRVAGELSKRNDRWMLQPEGVSSAYEIAGPDLSAGRCTITGEVRDLHPDSGAIRIDVSQLEKAP